MAGPSETWAFNPTWDHSQQGHGESDFSSQSSDLPSHQFNTTNITAGPPHGASGYPFSLSSQHFMPSQQPRSSAEHYPPYPSQGGEPHLSQVFGVHSSSQYFPQPSHHDPSQRAGRPTHDSTADARAGTLHVSPPTSSTFDIPQQFVSSPDSLPQTSPPSSSNRNTFTFGASAPEAERTGAQRPRRASPSPVRRGNATDSAAPHASKRQRSTDSDDEMNAQAEEQPQLKRACARCKGLKVGTPVIDELRCFSLIMVMQVRCKFAEDQDCCERCLKGPHGCVIPGKKVRRPPP